jgi:hypothetical protein
VRVAVWIRETGSGPPTHVRANSEPSPTEGPGEPRRTRPSPARGAPHTDEFGSLEPEPNRTRERDSYVYGALLEHVSTYQLLSMLPSPYLIAKIYAVTSGDVIMAY